MALASVRVHSDIPRAATRLIGREREMRDLTTLLLEPSVRLITLTGPGGIGKTRLALEAAQAVHERFASGVCYVPLAAIRDPDLVLPSIALQVGVREITGLSLPDRLASALRDWHVLLLLDNLEHLLPAATDLVWLLERCPGIKVFVTSRAPLKVEGEREYAVPPLPVPASNDSAALLHNDAMQLFTERASSVNVGFRLSDANAPIVGEICRRLDGLPLAIELAASRSLLLSPAAILARLDKRLPLLVGGASDLPDRLRTMRDAISWSYDLLSASEQRLFNHLSVFTGSFTLRQAELIESGAEVTDESNAPATNALAPILDGVSVLLNNSLLSKVGTGVEPRYLMLETIREYGLENLDSSEDALTCRHRHADIFLALAEAAAIRFQGAERSPWLERLDQAHGNLRAALTWLEEQGDTQRMLRMTGALWRFWWWRSHLSEARRWLETALAMPGADQQSKELASTLTGCGAIAETQGDYAAAEQYHAAAAEVWTQTGDTSGFALSLVFRWLVRFNAEDNVGMEKLSAESLRLYRLLDDPWGIAMSLMEQGVMEMRRPDPVAAEPLLNEAISGFQSISDEWGVAISQGVLANVTSEKGDYAVAFALLKESLTSLLVHNDLWGVATVMSASTRLAGDLQEWEWAVRLSAAVVTLHSTIGGPLKAPFRTRFEHTLGDARRALGEERYAAAWKAGERMSPREAVEEASKLPGSLLHAPAAKIESKHALAIPLSPREREVLRLIPSRTAREIGALLFISESTVRTHIDNILNKLGARNQKELIAMMYERGLI
jgi:non-specific serine/threonine protein kinase